MAHFQSWISGFTSLSPKARRKMLWLGATLFFFGAFLKLSWELREDSVVDELDKNILVFISKFRFAPLNGSAVDVTALGSPTVIALIVLIGAVILLLDRDRYGAAYLAIGATGAGVATSIMKRFFSRHRPTVVPRLVEVTGYSYPSGHSLAATSLYLLLMFLTWRYFTSWSSRAILLLCAILLIAAVCFSRLYLGVHYPSDVLSGVCLGTAWVCFLTAFFSRPR